MSYLTNIPITLHEPGIFDESIGIAFVTYSVPLTPFFFSPGSETRVTAQGIEFSKYIGFGIPQNTDTGLDGLVEDAPEQEVICGHKRYLRADYGFAWDDPDPRGALGGGLGHGESGSLDGFREFELVFNETTNTIDINVTSGGIDSSYLVNLGKVQDGRFYELEMRGSDHGWSVDEEVADEEWAHTRTETSTETLSEEITGAMLSGWMDTWLAKSPEFRAATAETFTGPVTGKRYACRDEDGKSEYQGIYGCYVVVSGHWFANTFTGFHGYVGEYGDFWNGNYHVFVNKVRRKNAPVITEEIFLASDGDLPTTFLPEPFGEGIYCGDGYREVILEEEVTGSVVDSMGVYPWNADGSWDESKAIGALALVPYSFDDDLFGILGAFGSSRPCELMLISRTGRQYRITVAVLGSEDYEPVATYQLVTDSTSKRVTIIPPHEDVGEGNFTLGAFTRIEENMAVSGAPAEWVEIAVTPTYDEFGDPLPDQLPDPSALIGSSPVYGTPIVAAFKIRSGVAYGHRGLIDLDTRFRVKRSLLYRDTPSPGTLPAKSCGDPYPSGYVEIERVSEYVEGVLRPTQAIGYVRVIDGIDWSPDDKSAAFTQYSEEPAGLLVIDTNTRARDEQASVGARHRGYTLRFDLPDPNGQIIGEEYSGPLPVSVSGFANLSVELMVAPPAEQSAVFAHEFRLGY